MGWPCSSSSRNNGLHLFTMSLLFANRLLELHRKELTALWVFDRQCLCVGGWGLPCYCPVWMLILQVIRIIQKKKRKKLENKNLNKMISYSAKSNQKPEILSKGEVREFTLSCCLFIWLELMMNIKNNPKKISSSIYGCKYIFILWISHMKFH